MRGLIWYLKSKLNIFIMLIILVVLFILISLVYKVKYIALFYMIAMMVCFVVLYLVIDYLKILRKIRFLSKLSVENYNANNWHLNNDMKDLVDQAYEDNVTQILNEMNMRQSEVTNHYHELKDMLTLWLHEIKLPISSLTLMIDNDEDDKSLIKGELTRIEQYSEMVMMLLKYESSSNDFLFEKVDLNQLILKSIKRFKYNFISKKLTINYENSTCYTITDRKHLQFILDQILSNAIKYTNSGGIKIIVLDDSVEIIDSGIGIAESDLPRIFEKNYSGINGHQLNQSSGMGLYLCKKISEMIDVDLKLESQVGVGTRVKIIFNSKITKM